MKKILLSLLLIITGLVIGLPGAVGYVAEQQHDKLVRQLTMNGQPLAEEHYERGWFSSKTRFRYRIEDEQLRKLAAGLTGEAEGTPELLVNSDIYHGPVPALGGGLKQATLAWTDVRSNLLLRAPSGREIPLPGELKSRVEPDGSAHFNYRAEADERQVGNGLLLRWDKADVDVLVGRGGRSADVKGRIGRMSLSDATASMHAGPAQIMATQQQTDNGLWTGDTTILLDEFVTPDFSVAGLQLATRVRESSNQATYAIDVQATDIDGQMLAGRDARLEVYAQRLDAFALAQLLQQVNDDEARPMPRVQRDALLRRVLETGPEVTIKTLRLPTSNSDIEGNAFVSIKPGTGMLLQDLAGNAQATADLLLPKELVEQVRVGSSPQVRKIIEVMMSFRVLRPEGNRYRVDAQYDKGKLTVNGFPVPIPVF